MSHAATMSSSRIHEIDPATAQQWLERGEAVLLDVREPDEYARQRIAGATLAPLSTFDAFALPIEHGKRVLVHCQSGRRSLEAAARLSARPGLEIFSIKGGIEAWIKSGQPIEENRSAPISIIRQVQITAGLLIVLGTVSGALVSPWWLILSGFVGAGLVFAGLSGTCGMAVMLAKLPWNRIAINSERGMAPQRGGGVGCGEDCG